MTAAELDAWQRRLGLSQTAAARRMNVPVATYRNWIYGRRAIPEPVALLTRYLERYGPLDTVAS